jgi:hypothetical protein
MRPEPKIIHNVLEPEYLKEIQAHYKSTYKTLFYDEQLGRYTSNEDKIKDNLLEHLTTLARQELSPNAVPSYSMFAHYEGEKANLFKHKDNNACTYTIDLCVYQTEPWDLYVDDKSYTLQPNDALLYYGNDQEHWREQFPNPATQQVGMMFLHYVEPTHWYITRGREYHYVITGQMSEEQYKDRYNR